MNDSGESVRHSCRVRSEDYRDGLDGYHGDLPLTTTRWVAACSCGWEAMSGVAVRTHHNRENARAAWRGHKRLMLIGPSPGMKGRARP